MGSFDDAFNCIGDSFRIYMKSWKELLLGSLVYSILLSFASLILVGIPIVIMAAIFFVGLSFPGAPLHLILSIGATFLALLIILTLIAGILFGGFTLYCDGVITGKKLDILEILNPPRKLSFAMTPIIQGLPAFVILGVFFGLFLTFISIVPSKTPLHDTTQLILFFLVWLVLFVLSLLLALLAYFSLLLTPYAVALEKTGAIEGAKRSFHLVRENFVSVLIFVIVLSLVMFGIWLLYASITLPISFVPIIVPLGEMLSGLLNFIYSVLIAPIPVVAYILFYKRLIERNR